VNLFAGIVSLDAAVHLPSEQVLAELRARLTRAPEARPDAHVTEAGAFFWIDFGLYGTGGVQRDPTGSVSMLAGDPLCGTSVGQLCAEWRARSTKALQASRGSFCGVHFDATERRFWLLTDKLGLRPLYYFQSGPLVVFASALRVLDGFSLVPGEGDLQAVTETACFGYPLAARTPLAAVRTVEPAQIVEITAAGLRISEYWRWDDIPVQNATPDEACAVLRDTFHDAVRLRLGSARRVPALLSGGLDSRCVVAGLRHAGAAVDTINFGPEGSADLVLGRKAAEALGTNHFEVAQGSHDFWSRLGQAHAQWHQHCGAQYEGTNARLLWTGEGGDRVLAPVNLSHAIVTRMRADEPDKAIATYMHAERSGLPRRLFRHAAREWIRRLPQAGVRAELERYDPPDRARRFHLYVLLNESRRNIYRHFEDLDLNQFELVMPFYDAEMVRAALSFPFDPFIGHELYYRWLSFLPAPVSAVAWQPYPTAPRCPLPLPADVRMQWSGWYSRAELREQRRSYLGLSHALMRAAQFPHWLLNRQVLAVARVLLCLGVQRYGYVFDVARPFVQYPPDERSSPQY